MPTSRQAGVTIYLQEELSDARLRVDELKGYIVQALELVNNSSQKDHLYAVAGDLICAIPECILKAERALEATAMAVNKIDYEELRQVLRPEKVDELERILEDVRVRIPRRTGRASVSGKKAPDPGAIAQMEIIWRDEGIEATTIEDAVDMYAWELGHQKAPSLPGWFVQLGKDLGIDVVASYEDGKSSGGDDYDV